MHIHIPNYKCHLNLTLFYVWLRFHLINTIATRIVVNATIKNALTELPLLPLLPLPPFTLSPLLLSLIFASSRFDSLHLSVKQQVVYKQNKQYAPKDKYISNTSKW